VEKSRSGRIFQTFRYLRTSVCDFTATKKNGWKKSPTGSGAPFFLKKRPSACEGNFVYEIVINFQSKSTIR
jgi:hypothetical protein